MKRILLSGGVLLGTLALAQPSNEFLLKVSPVAERLTVWIGNAAPLEYRNLDRIRLQDISSRLKAGNNTVRFRWQGLERLGDLSIRNGAGDVLFSYPFDDTRLPINGDVRFTVAVPQQGPQFVSAVTAARSSEATVPSRVRLNVSMSGGMLSLTLNGRAVGDYLGTTNRTLEAVRGSQNTLKIRWSKDFGVSLPQGALELRDADGKRLLFWNTDKVRSLQGEQTLTFRAP